MSSSGGGGELMALTARIGYVFTDSSLLELALTHCSLGGNHSERLEFLGDAVLDLVIAAELYNHFPDWPEGKLSRMRASLVDRAALLQTAKSWQLARSLRVSKGERTAGGLPRSNSVVANAVEAVLGAVYLDGGFSAASQVVVLAWRQRLLVVGEQQVVDAKSRLQEWTQERGLGPPDYLCDD
ncbi:MAG: ribonuclease III family protein, partial [Mariprofundales bacterium]